MENWDNLKKSEEKKDLSESYSSKPEKFNSSDEKIKNKQEDDLLEFIDDGDPKFLEKKRELISDIRKKLESLSIGDYKINPESVFINPSAFDLAQGYGLSETFEILKNEFLYALEHDRSLEKKLNIFSIVGNYLENGNRRQNLILYKKKIVENFENSIKMPFLTEASSDLLKNNPQVRVIDYSNELKEGFNCFFEKNENALNNFFSEKEIDIDKNNKISIKRDKIIFSDFDFEKGEIYFESEKYKMASEDLDRIVESEKLSSIKEIEDFISFLKSELGNFSKPGMFFGSEKRESREKIKKEILNAKKNLEYSLERLKRKETKTGGYAYHNEFIETFNSFKIKLDPIEKKMSKDDQLKYKSIVNNFRESLSDLKSFGQDLYDAESLKFNLRQSTLASYGKGKIYFSAEINDLKSFSDFGEIIKLAFLNKPLDYKGLSETISNFVGKLDKILSTFSPDDFKKFEYFKLLKNEFNSFCLASSGDSQFVKDMTSRFF